MIMKKLMKIFLTSVPLLFIVSIALGVGFGDWVFETATSEESATGDYIADPVRENDFFSGDYDYVQTGSRSYDVYFMAQMANVTEHIVTTTGAGETLNVTELDNSGQRISGTVTNYTIQEQPVPYSSNKYYGWGADTSNLEDYGAWTDGNGNLLTDDISQDQNRYFIRYQSVTELTPDQVESLGNPSFRLNDRLGYNLSFLCWTPCYDLPVYKLEGSTTVFPSPTSREDNYDGSSQSRRVHGYSPYSEVFTSLYAGTLLEYYETLSYGGISYTNSESQTISMNYVWYVNGRPSIFFFPVYSGGKNYLGTTKDSIQLKEMTVDPTTGEETQSQVSLFNYDGVYTAMINDAFTASNPYYFTSRGNTVSYECYRLSRKLFDTNHHYYIETDADRKNRATNPTQSWRASGWSGTWTNILEMVPTLVTGDYINMYLIVKIDTDTSSYRWNKNQTTLSGTYVPGVGDYAGQEKSYNEYATIIDESEYSIIDGALASEGLMKYYSRGQYETLAKAGNAFELGDNESRDYYMVYERFYTPKLIGGSSEVLNYVDSDMTFTKEGIGAQSHNWVLRNVELTGDSTLTYSFTQVIDGVSRNIVVTYPSTYFGALVSPLAVQIQQRINYSMVVAPDDPATDSPPAFDSSTTTGETRTYYQSDDIFVSATSPDNPDFYDAEAVSVTIEGVTSKPISLGAAINDYGVTTGTNFSLLRVKTPGTYTIMFQVEYVESSKFYDLNGTEYEEVLCYDANQNLIEQYTTGMTLYDINGNIITTPELIVTRELPQTLVAWGYVFSNKFINICDITDADSSNWTLQFRTNTNQEHYVNTQIHSYYSNDNLYNAYLTSSLTFITDGTGDTITLGEIVAIIETYNETATRKKELVELVSGHRITSADLANPHLRITKNYVLVIKYVDQEIPFPS